MRSPISVYGIASIATIGAFLSGCTALPTSQDEGTEFAAIAKRAVYFSSTYPANAASATAIHTPTLVASSILGPAIQSPASQYISGIVNAPLPTHTGANTQRVVNQGFTDDYPVWNGTGTISLTTANQANLKSLITIPSYSRDQGKGGYCNGKQLFIFADTQTYTAPTASQNGNFTGAVSTSAAVDVGGLAKNGQPLVLLDQSGTFAGPKGGLRNFVPFTTGEAAYNNANNGASRYAIWPHMGLLTLNPTTSLLYAPIVWTNISAGSATFQSVGVTLCKVTVPTNGGPVCQRVAPRLFPSGGIEFGAIGGVRSYGSSGKDGGNVYVFGNNGNKGLLLGRVAAGSVANLDAYQYFYPGVGWSSTMPARGSTANFYNGSFSTVDVFYSPRHLTFIMVYQNAYVDNTLYWRYLLATNPILPTYAGGKDADIASALTKYKWSAQMLLMKMPTPPTGYNYGGGANLGYFGTNDISRGGTKMLVHWTEPTGKNAASKDTGYWMNTAVATFA